MPLALPAGRAAAARSALRPAARIALVILAAAVVALPVFVGGFLLKNAWRALFEVGPAAFLTDELWSPRAGQFGLAPMLAGSVVVSAGALTIAAPAAGLWALRVNLFAGPRGAAIERAVVDTLAGIPSVVFGLCGLVALVPLIRSVAPPGLSLLAGCLVLGAMIFPLAAAAGDAAIQQADPSEFASARALGLGAWDAARLAILPRALPAFSTGCLLALGRALGETMALLMVAGNTIAWPGSLATPFRTLTMHVASEMAYASGTHRSALFVAAGLLLTLVGAIGLVGTLGGARDRGA